MGCGSSSMKGEKVEVDEHQPAKRVQTNFSEVNFAEGAAPDRRGTMAVAPNENHPDKISEERHIPPTIPEVAGDTPPHHQEGAKLEPYKSLDEVQTTQLMQPQHAADVHADPYPTNVEGLHGTKAGTVNPS